MLKNKIRQILTPTRIILGSFVFLICVGTFFLIMPLSIAGNGTIKFSDALFVATSAVCVTGLAPIDISTDLSFFGQFVVLFLMQVGGLGLMTFTTTFYFLLGQRLPISDRLAIQETYSASPKQIRSIIFYVVRYTFVIESLGAFALFIYWTIRGQFNSLAETAWFSVFHAISAFTHGSFSLFPDSLIRFQDDFIVQIIFTTLIILGGIGFLVAFEVISWVEFLLLKGRRKTKRFRLSVQSRLTLLTTLGIILCGTILLFICERNHAFAGFSYYETWMNSYFFSIVPRTSGFNTVDMTDFSAAGTMLLMIMMFIGASSGSTAGGIKISTFGILAAYLFARLRGETQLNLWKRTIPQQAVDKAFVVVVASILVIVVAVTILLFTETRGMSSAESQTRFLPVMFETVSAFGTVGLTLDFTDKLSEQGKFVVIIVMIMGRIGAISMATAISKRRRNGSLSYAEENIIIG